MLKKIKYGVLVLVIVFCTTCNNFFHELVPQSGDRITGFQIQGQVHAEIGENTIFVTVSPGTSFDSVIPSIQVSEGATLIPVTREYLAQAFSDESTFGAAMQIYLGGSMTNTVIEMIRNNNDFTRPVLNIPIDFSYPVDFLVVSGLGTVRQYTVKVEVDSGEGKFLSFKADKFFNPEIVLNPIRNTTGIIDTAAKTVTLDIYYPVEYIASYELIPTFETNNARVFLDDGTEIKNNETLITFISDIGTQIKTLTLRRAGFDDSTWTLIVNFREDPDTIRSIIDFRFNKTQNPLISADYMATITDTGDTGTITVTVFYTNTKPAELRPSFVSPGIVTVAGATQTSGITTQDFSSPLLYTVTSRIGGYVRTYTVTVILAQATDPLPVISSFNFNTMQNTSLVSNSMAMIDHNARLILIEAAYDGTVPPSSLVPSFAATGTVTVNGIIQTSGSTSNNFAAPITYTVTNPSNPTLKRDYRVETLFVQSLSSVAEITSFSFFVADHNGELIDNVDAEINHTTGTITATLLFNTPGGNRTLIPRWSAQGTVEVGGITQTSGDKRQFYTPQTYRVVSADRVLQKNYTVTIKEVNTRIFVRQNATGLNNGTSWQNAYTNMPQAATDASLFPDEYIREVWIAEGTYTPSDRGNASDYLIASPNTSYLGGFAGNETSIPDDEYRKTRRATITGDLGGGVRSPNFFRWFGASNSTVSLNDNFLFENILFTDSNGAVINIRFGDVQSLLQIVNCDFIDLQANQGCAIFIQGNMNVLNQNIIITNTTIENVQASSAAAILAINISSININNCKIINAYAFSEAGAFFFPSTTSTIISDTDFINVTAHGNAKIMKTYNYDTFSFEYRGTVTFNRCKFIHNDDLNNITVRYDDSYPVFFMMNGSTTVFNDCEFTNLRSNYISSDTFLFTRNSSPGAVFSTNNNINFQNCHFTLKSGERMGIVSVNAGVSNAIPCRLIIENCMITNNGSTQPLFEFSGSSTSTSGTFRFRGTNRYNGTVITAGNINSLGTNVVRIGHARAAPVFE